MTRRHADAFTGELFSTIPAPMPQTAASMDYRAKVAQLVSQAIKDADSSRWVIAARMSELADVETSKAILDSYTAESRDECNLPFWKTPLLEAATGSRALAEWHAGVLGGRVLWGAEILDADLGNVERQIVELQEQRKRLRAFQQQRGRRS